MKLSYLNSSNLTRQKVSPNKGYSYLASKLLPSEAINAHIPQIIQGGRSASLISMVQRLSDDPCADSTSFHIDPLEEAAMSSALLVSTHLI